MVKVKNPFFTLFPILLFLFIIAGCGKKAEKQMPIPEIPVVNVTQEDIPIYKEFVGQVFGLFDIPIRARVEGFLEEMHFSEGTPILKGKLLYSIDAQPFEAEVAAKLSKVAEAKTDLVKAENDLKRIRPLAEINAVSQSDLDAALAEEGAAKAAVEAAEANLELSRIQLSYTQIYSPIRGIIGKTKAKEGEFVGREPNPVILNTISRIDTIRVEFFLTETDYLSLARAISELPEGRQIEPDTNRRLELILADGSLHKYRGKFDFIDREVDPTTGAILIQASFPNPDKLIRPGQFARIRAIIDVEENGMLIPQRCVRELQGRHQVYIINDSNKVEIKTVEVGPTQDDMWMIKSGLSPNDRIIVEGLQKIRPGMVVKPVESGFQSIRQQQKNS